jgi:hypothetical protein
VIPATKAIAWSEDLPGAERLQLLSLGRGQHGVDARLRLNEQGIEAWLHLLSKAAKVRRLLTHDRVDALLLLGREIELVRKPLAHAVGATHVDAPRPAASPLRRTTEARRSKPTATSFIAVAVQGQSIRRKAEPHPRERDDGE